MSRLVRLTKPRPLPDHDEQLERIIRLARAIGTGDAAKALAKATSTAVRSLNRLSESLRPMCNTPEAVAALEGKYYARGALSPELAEPEDRDQLVQLILSGVPGDDQLRYLTNENRALVAVAVVRGWMTRPGCPCTPGSGTAQGWSFRCPSARHRHYAEVFTGRQAS